MRKESGKTNAVAGSIVRLTVGRLFLAETIYTFALMLFYLLAYYICRYIIVWQGDELFYILAERIVRTLGTVYTFLIVWLLGAIILVILHDYRMGRYIQDISAAAAVLIDGSDTFVDLPAPLQPIELQMNRLKSESLRNARDAKEAEQRKNDLIVYLAHDLKTPLTSVIGYLSLLKDEKEISPALQMRYTDIALSKAQRLEYLINEFFEITRFSLTRLTIQPETVNLTRMLEQITFEFNPIMAERNLLWELSLLPDLEIVCDPEKLERVFDNLIRNAIRYSYPDTVISVRAESAFDTVTLRFTNSGRTIPAEKLDRLFEQFYRMDSSRASETGGAGLGLAIAKEIVTLHGGSLGAESADEKVTFTVTLPRTLRKK